MAIPTYSHSSGPSATPVSSITAPPPRHPAPTARVNYLSTPTSCSPTPAISAGPANDELPMKDVSTTYPTYPSADLQPLSGAVYRVESPSFEYQFLAGCVVSTFGDEIKKSIESEGQEHLWLDGMCWPADEGMKWCGYVQYAESSERSSLRREAKRAIKASEEVGVGVESEKRVSRS